MVGVFDYTGWTMVFVFGFFAAALAAALYLRERRGLRRPGRMSRYGWGIINALFITFLVGLRRFVFHQ